ncbi:MAG: hypothetical protein HC875_21590 [Anaerolineales bacterium]|nr:hypothetical protein [Anaerolineales bacterium]
MDALIQWLIHDNQKDLFEFLVALALNLVFLALSSLLLWPLDKLALVWSMLKGHIFLWLIIFVTAVLLNVVQRFFRMNMYDRANAYIGSALAVCGLLLLGWAAFAALAVPSYIDGGSVWTGVILYLVGGLSCLSAFFAVTSFYQGAVYKLISLPLTLVSFLIFSLWPNGARLAFGWFFQLF